MPLRELIILLPCQGLDDFPTDLSGTDADGLLAAWTACFHPWLLAELGRLPKWHDAQSPPDPQPDECVVIPSVSHSRLPEGYAQRVAQAGGRVVAAGVDRPAIADQLLAGNATPGHGDRWVADFFALGFGFLQIELLTRQMRYSSTLDTFEFQQRTIQAAQAVVSGQPEMAGERLTAAFDMLAQQRDHYYPVEVYLLDLSLVEAGLGDAQDTVRWEEPVAQNVILTGASLQRLALRQPAAVDSLRRGVAEGRIGLLTPGAYEVPWPWIPSECLLDNLQMAIDQFQRYVDTRPHGYGGRQPNLSPALPRLLSDLKLKSAWHIALDGSHFPTSHQSKTTWEGWGGASVSAVARPPLDARHDAPFIRLALDLGESMDMDYVAMRCWVHWLGSTARSLGDLRRVAKYGSALGRFITWTGLIDESPDTGHWDRFSLDDYQTALLTSTRVDPVSGSCRFWQRWAALWQQRTWAAQLWLLGEPTERAKYEYARLLSEPAPDLQDTEKTHLLEIAGRLARRLGFTPLAAERADAAWLLVNAGPSTARTTCRLPGPLGQPPRPGGAVYACRAVIETQDGTQATVDAPPAETSLVDMVVDVPALGFVALPRTESFQTDNRSEDPPMVVEGHTLRNEFFEARIDHQTGGLRSLRSYRDRTNRLSQQLGIRMPRRASSDARYSEMVCDRMSVIQSTSIGGRIRTEGRLLDWEGQTLATYCQEYALARGSRVLNIELQCDLRIELQADPWEHYLACRFAWADESAIVYRNAHLARASTESQKLEAPLLVELDQQVARTAIFPYGCPYHRRIGFRRLDTLLVVAGETQRHFRLGIGVDIKYAMLQALLQLAPPIALPVESHTWKQDRGWLFHIDSPHVLATDWQPVVNSQGNEGLRVHLQEISGQSATGKLRTARPPSRAQQVSLDGDLPRRLTVDQEGCTFEISPYDLIAIELYWGEET